MPQKSVRSPLPARFAGPSWTTGWVGEVTSEVEPLVPVALVPEAAVRTTAEPLGPPRCTSMTTGAAPGMPECDGTLGWGSGLTTAGLAPPDGRSPPPASSDPDDR